MNQRRADVFAFVHHPEPDGLWCVVDVRTNVVVLRGLAESEAISAVMRALANHRAAQSAPASVIALL